MTWTVAGQAGLTQSPLKGSCHLLDQPLAIIGPGRAVRLVLRFAGVADPQFPDMFHCHILEHADMGMMGQFSLVD